MPKKRRRGNGEGSIFQIKDGRWRGCITVGYAPDGRQLRKWRTASTQRELIQKLNQIAHLSSSKVVHAPESFTLEQWLERFMVFKVKDVRPRTQEAHRYYASKVMLHLGHKRLTALTRSHFRKLYGDLADEGLSVSVRRHVHHFVKAALNEAFQERIIDRNPALVDVPKGEPARKGVAWTPEQVDTFLTFARADRLYPLFYLLLHQGLRIGEALALTWDDYDGERLTVKQTLSVVDNALMLGPPKTGRGYRTFYLLPGARDVLEAHKAQSSSLFIFTTELGTLLDPHNVRRSYRRIIKRAGLSYIRLHDHRHTFITLARRAGIPTDVVAALVGQDPTVTTLIYTHVSDEQKKEAMKKLDEYLKASVKQLKDAA